MSRTTYHTWAAAVACAAALSGCSETIREGDGPVQAMVTSLEAAPGAEPSRTGVAARNLACASNTYTWACFLSTS